MGTNSCFDIDFVVATVFCKSIELVVNFIYLLQKTHPYLHKDGKNCYEKEFTSKLAKSKCK